MNNKISIQSEYLLDDGVDEGFKFIAESGFNAMDINIDSYLPESNIRNGELDGFYSQSVEELKEYFTPHKLASKKYGIEIHQAHAPFPSYVPDRDDVNDGMIEILKKCIELCDFLDCRNLIVHPAGGIRYVHGADCAETINLNMYEKLAPHAKKFGVTICLENMFERLNGRYSEGECSDFSTAARWIDILNEKAGCEVFGFCLDTGHAFLLKKDIRQAIRILGDRIKCLHIHDNDGENDRHMMPYAYAAKDALTMNPWDEFIRGLQDINYKGVLSFETFRCVKIFPKELHSHVIRLIAATGKYFSEQIDLCEKSH